MSNREINPTNVNIRPITAEEYVARNIVAGFDYIFQFDPKIKSVRIDLEDLSRYIFAIQGMKQEDIKAEIQAKISVNSIVQQSSGSDFAWA